MNKPVFKFLFAGFAVVFFAACTTSLPVEDDEDSEISEISDGWSWDVPKKARMNPKYDYGTLIDTRDNKTYMTVTIGEQTWMAENLNYADSVSTPSLKGRSWCFNDVAANCEVTGRLYTWAAAMDSVTTGCGDDMKCSLKSPVQGICPSGWHLPDSTDWRTLFKVLGGQIYAGRLLKSQSGWFNKGNGPDSVSFSALPGGYRHFYEGFLEDGRYAYFWCSTDRIGGINAHYMDLSHFETAALLEYGYKVNGYSIRCLQDPVDNTDELESSSSISVQSIYEAVEESGVYTTKDSVAAYLCKFDKLPTNYVGKNEGKKLYESETGNTFEKWNFNPWTTIGVMIGGDNFDNFASSPDNYHETLPEGSYHEADVEYSAKNRGTKRLVYQPDCVIYYTADHYETFTRQEVK